MLRYTRIAIAAALIAAGFPATGHATVLGFQFSSQKPGTTTGMTLHIRYTKTGGGPNDKPSPIRQFRLDAPAGTAFNTAGVAQCDASDTEVTLQGTAACPSASRVATGTVTVVTGFGPPFDPFVSPTPVYNDGKGWLEISQTPSNPPVTIAVTRLTVSGSRVSGPIAATPGGPPDGQTAVSAVDLSFPASTGFIIAPPICPASGRWAATGTFGFADGTTQVVTEETPCTVSKPRPPATAGAIGASLAPRRVKAGRSARLRVKLRSSDPACVDGATVRLPGFGRTRTDSAGRATIVKTFHRTGRRTLVAAKRGCTTGRATLTVQPGSERERADS